ncbi:hypothetical protein ACNFJ7_04075 [Sphingomonas sp. HT-1]|uniref:hypothetical protein n=1 Tax=unclassified Sphingomonas TaxID=196159 RepID=UPI0002EC45CC|nr:MULTISPECIES: hypothetical protein [unclassified Sphingomonas]KTF67300.1 hypothetical protein ATB93_18420 [Sphingomonas sp. WG]
MLHRIGRLFIIKSKFEAFLVIFGLANGAVERGTHYLAAYPGAAGKLLFGACALAVMMAGGHILDSLEHSA